MSRLSPSDNLFATAYVRGTEVFRFCGTGITGMTDLIAKIRDHAPVEGMVTLNVRNSSQGWSYRSSIYLAV